MLLKLDLHVHTFYSYDGLITPTELVWQLKRKKLDGVAITDHDTIKGQLIFKKALDKHGFIFIPGIEISAKNAHILALNVTEAIPAGLEIEETIDYIHRAGGLAIASHPVAIYKGWAKNLSRKFDAVEVVNSSSFPFHFSSFFGKRLAARLELPQVAGSDAHYHEEVGAAYTIVEVDNPSLDDILKAIENGATLPLGEPLPLHVRLRRETLILKRKLV